LREAFKLTPAEVRIAQLVASGESLDDAAEILGIQRETARVQLKAVFSKTDTHRQGELVALMASLLGARIAST
jgi:DNA-binding CsgD family transcriptional regulator